MRGEGIARSRVECVLRQVIGLKGQVGSAGQDRRVRLRIGLEHDLPQASDPCSSTGTCSVAEMRGRRIEHGAREKPLKTACLFSLLSVANP